MSRIIATTIAVFTCTSLALAVTIHVPSQYPTIQAGIIAAQNGDTVLVAQGTYLERIDFLGREIVVISESGPELTLIQWSQQYEEVVTFNTGEGRGAVLEGFTVQHTYPGDFAGSGVHCGPGTAPTIRGNILTGNGSLMAYFGGGIYAFGASPLIEGNQIVDNEACYFGAGLYLENCSDFAITGNTIASNYTFSGFGVATGGGIYAKNSSGIIDHNLIFDNICDPPFGQGGGGIALEESGNYQISNNTLDYNVSALFDQGTGGGLYIVGSANVNLHNNIIVNNQGGGIYCVSTGPSQWPHDFNDVWNNSHFNYFGCLPGPFDISADPQFVGGSPFSYELTQTSPCIDAGAFVTEPDPDGTRADMGAFYFDQEGINVALVPDRWPIVIPVAGGSFSYAIHLTNHTASATNFDIWVDVWLPDSTVFGPIILREGLTFNPNQYAQRDLTQAVPGGAPAGNYLYMAHTGDYSTGAIYHETLMPFTKEGTEGFSGHWAVNPDPGDWGGGLRKKTSQSQSIGLSASPNPFNPAAMLRFDLTQSGHVVLKIYDLTGRSVATLLDRNLHAGAHSVHFDGGHLVSGVYLAVLETEKIHTVERLLLVK